MDGGLTIVKSDVNHFSHHSNLFIQTIHKQLRFPGHESEKSDLSDVIEKLKEVSASNDELALSRSSGTMININPTNTLRPNF